jgi:hypothetical protein
MFESGVAGYVVGKATVEVHFPIDFRGNVEIACKHCPFLSNNERICQLNKKPVAYPHKYVGNDCPLKAVEDKYEIILGGNENA